MRERVDRTFREEGERLLRFIRNRVSVPEDAEDILQDIFVQAVRNLNALQAVDNLLAWMYTAARNRIVDWYRRRRRRTEPLDAEPVRARLAEASLATLGADSGLRLERERVRALAAEAVLEALEELPAAQREVFRLQALEGVAFREISERTGVPVNTLIARKRYAVLALRERLREVRALVDELGDG